MVRRRRSSLATVLFTDIVSSSEIAVELGDRRWKSLLEAHHAIVRRALRRHGGRELDTAGDGFFAVFDTQAEAIRCAAEIVREVRTIGLEVRAGLHVGETELIAGKTGGVSVHTGARLGSTAGPGEVVVSGVLRDLVPGSGIEFTDRGARRLKGIPDEVRSYSVRAVNGLDLGEPLDPAEASRRRSNVPAAERRRRPALVVGAVGGALAIAIVTTVVAGGDAEGPERPATRPIPPDTLVRIDPDTLEVEGSYPLGHEVIEITSAAGRLWIDEGTILEIFDPATGTFEDVPLGFTSCEMAPTNDAILIADCKDRRLYRVDPTGALEPMFRLPPFGDFLFIVDTVEATWILALEGSGDTVSDRLYKVDRTTGSILGRLILRRSEEDAFGLVETSSGWLWTFNYDTGDVLRITPSTLDTERILELTQPNSIATNGDSLWVSDVGTGEVVRIDELTGDVEDRAERVQGNLTSGEDAAWALDLERLYRIGEDEAVHKRVDLPYTDAGSYNNPILFDGRWLWVAVRAADD